MKARLLAVGMVLLALIGFLGSAQEYGLETFRTVPMDGSPWIVPGVPKVVMRIYLEDQDSDPNDVVIQSVHVYQDKFTDPAPSLTTSYIKAIRLYDVTTSPRTLIAEDTTGVQVPVIEQGAPLTLTWTGSPANRTIPDDGARTYELEIEVDPVAFLEGESLRLILIFDQYEGSVAQIRASVVDDQEDVVSTTTADKGLETVSDENVGAGLLNPGAKGVLIQEIRLADNDDDRDGVQLQSLIIDNTGTATSDDIDRIIVEGVNGGWSTAMLVNAFPVTIPLPGTANIQDNGQETIRIKVDVAATATTQRTLRFKTRVRHQEGAYTGDKWVYDETEEAILQQPSHGGLETIEDHDVAAGTASPGWSRLVCPGQRVMVMEVTLIDHDPALHTSDVDITEITVTNQGTATNADITKIEITAGSLVLGTATAFGAIPLATPIHLNDPGSGPATYTFQVWVTIANAAADGNTLRLELALYHQENLWTGSKWVCDGTEEVISNQLIDKGLEVSYVDSGPIAIIPPRPAGGAPIFVKVCEVVFKDVDGPADFHDVYISELRIWNDLYHIHPLTGIFPTADRNDIQDLRLLVTGGGFPAVTVPVAPPPDGMNPAPHSGPLTANPVKVNFVSPSTPLGLVVPDDGVVKLEIYVSGTTSVTIGAALRFYFEVVHEEGGNPFVKTDPDGVTDYFGEQSGGTPPEPEPSDGEIDFSDCTLNPANNYTCWMYVTGQGLAVDTGVEVVNLGVQYDPDLIDVTDVKPGPDFMLLNWFKPTAGHVRLVLTKIPSGTFTNGLLFKMQIQALDGGEDPVTHICADAGDIKLDGIPFTGTVQCGTITIEPGNGGGCGLKGDVNGNGSVELNDAVLVARHIMAAELLTDPCALERADVNCDGDVDIFDAYLIVQHVMEGEPFPCATSPVAFDPGKQPGAVQLEFERLTPAELIATFAGAELGAVHGVFKLIGQGVRVADVQGENGLQLLAYNVTEEGLLEFVGVSLSGAGSLRVVLESGTLETVAVLSLSLYSSSGVSLTFDLEYVGLTSPTPKVLTVSNTPNPVQDVNTTYFHVEASLPVEEIRVLIYDLSGRLVYDSGWVENDHAWHLEDLAGNVVANGIYLYTVQVKIAGVVVQSGLQRLAVLR